MISKKLCIASFMFLLISGVGFSQTSNIREIQYLSGTDNERLSGTFSVPVAEIADIGLPFRCLLVGSSKDLVPITMVGIM